MLKRKIERRLEKFYADNGKSALLIDGARQVGKSFIVESFGRSHYESVVVIDFLHHEEARAIFQDVTDASEILTRITAFSRQPLIGVRSVPHPRLFHDRLMGIYLKGLIAFMSQ